MSQVRVPESTAVRLIAKGVCDIDDFVWEDEADRQSALREFGSKIK